MSEVKYFENIYKCIFTHMSKILISDKIAYEIMNMMNSDQSIIEICKTLEKEPETIEAFINQLRKNEFLSEA